MFIQSYLVSSESHNIRHNHQACHLEIALLSSFGHLGLFKVILIDVSQKQDSLLSYKRHNNVDLISETYKLQIRRFNHSTPV